jgi:histidinol-phosphatase (PHP family)
VKNYLEGVMKANYHSHSYFCDGHGEPEAYYDRAKELGFDAIGMSGHAPLPFETDWTMAPGRLSEYSERIRGLADEDGPEIYLGLEIDYIHGLMSPGDDRPLYRDLDYRIGSVHFLGSDGQRATVDGPLEEMDFLHNEVFGGSSRSLVEAFYAQVRAMIDGGGFDILGHFDLVKKNNRGNRYFNPDDSWYRDAVMQTLETLDGSGVLLEINTGGLSRGTTDSVYPEPWILGEAAKRDIDIVYSADAHRPEHIDFAFDLAEDVARDAGFRSRRILVGGSWRETDLHHS